jgi:CRISPR-associated protein Csx17
MDEELFVHTLTGCTLTPLANYLKALGILRVVAEQLDATVSGCWLGEVFRLRTTLSLPDVQMFFLQNYRPTPIVAPWNGGSGFYPNDRQDAIAAIGNGESARFADYRHAIAVCRDICRTLRLDEKPDRQQKLQVLQACRGLLPDECITWLDAAVILTDAGPRYAPLLGTGGNDGRLDFTNHMMQRLIDLIDPQSGEPSRLAASWWDEAVLGRVTDRLPGTATLGQFDPATIDRPVNPWDFVLMMEGALVFSASASRRFAFKARGAASFPFCAASAAVGYPSAAAGEESTGRGEIWLPVWARPCGIRELQRLFGEGRADVNGRPVRNALEFARAAVTRGVEPGIHQFVRIGFHERNGHAHFASPLGRLNVQPKSAVESLGDARLDAWLEEFRFAARSENAPTEARLATTALESAILLLCQQGIRRLTEVLVALGRAEAVLASHGRWRFESRIAPLPPLPGDWLRGASDLSAEYRLAASLAGIASDSIGGLRQYLEPVRFEGDAAVWSDHLAAVSQVVWKSHDLVDNLIAVSHRRGFQALRSRHGAEGSTFPLRSIQYAALDDVAQFIDGQIDDVALEDLVRGLILVDWNAGGIGDFVASAPLVGKRIPHAAYALLKCCHSPFPIRDEQVCFDPSILNAAAGGQIERAVAAAARRLSACRLAPTIRTATCRTPAARRLAAALMFPIGHSDMQLLADSVLLSEAA